MTNPLDHIARLSAWLKHADIGLLELRGPNGTLRLLNDGVAVHAVAAEEPPERHTPTMVVRAASPGVFLDRHPLHQWAIASAGAEVEAGKPLGFLQVGPLLTAVSAPHAGLVTGVLAGHGMVVGYGAPLCELQPIEDETP